MFLNFDVYDSKDTLVGNTALSLDFNAHMWAISEDKTGAWKRVATARSGKFDVKDWGVIWMWDKSRNIVIIHDSPKGGNDLHITNGTARLYDPVDSSLKDSIAKWKMELSGAAKVSMVLHKPLPLNRQAYIE